MYLLDHLSRVLSATLTLFMLGLQTVRSYCCCELYHAGKSSYKKRMNAFSDLTHEEFLKSSTGSRCYKPNRRLLGNSYKASSLSSDVELQVPESVDWRSKGAVTPAREQGECGACWAFSAAGAVEGQWFRKTGALVSFSVQQLVDCTGDSAEGLGCSGGDTEHAFRYIKDKGIESSGSYPYTGTEDKCRYQSSKVVANVTGTMWVTPGSEVDLKTAVALHGPISVAIDSSQISFKKYSSGVYDDPACSSTNLTHYALLVGYGTSSEGVDYWIIKNSWGKDWGLNGFALMSRNKNNQCGIAAECNYPVV